MVSDEFDDFPRISNGVREHTAVPFEDLRDRPHADGSLVATYILQEVIDRMSRADEAEDVRVS